MKILITGANGFLGQKLVTALAPRKDIQTLATARNDASSHPSSNVPYEKLDICEAREIEKVLARHLPDVLINAAAAAQVDWCETHREDAWKTNAQAVGFLAEACQKKNIHLIHLSTDFVFDGSNGPYHEEDTPHPLSYYGETKLEGEKNAQKSSAPWTIIRTILVYGVLSQTHRTNPVLSIKNTLEKGTMYKASADHVRAPTLAEDLAAACIATAEKKARGIYHVAGPDIMNIFKLAQEVARFFKLDESLIEAVHSDVFKSAAKRPPKTGFILDKAKKDLNYAPHSFVQGLEIVQNQLARFRQ